MNETISLVALDRQRLAGFPRDPRWQAVFEETHRRPPLPLALPGVATHFVFHTEDIGSDRHYTHIRALLAPWQAVLEIDRPDQIVARTPTATVKWEKHTEFCSLTVLTPADKLPDFPTDWQDSAPAPVILALRVWVDGTASDLSEVLEERRDDVSDKIVSLVSGGGALVEADFRAGEDGFTHIRVLTSDLNPSRVGRLVQRLTEIETYRVLSLYAWPDVQMAGPKLNAIDHGLIALTEQLGGAADGSEGRFLSQLTALASDLERINAQTHFRLNASSAYYDLVQRRLEELGEAKVDGAQRLSNFVNRRLSPAARTYRSILNRQREMSDRVARTSQLLRSRVDVELAEQNQAILKSMNRRAEQQYLLQQTVEGLSVVAVSYYAIGILSYALTALSAWNHDIDPKLWTGFAAPLVVLLVFLGIRSIRKRMHISTGH